MPVMIIEIINLDVERNYQNIKNFGILAEINKHDELKRKFDELYKANIYLLDNPNELLSKVESLSQDLNKDEIEGKIRSLKRF